MQTTPKSSDETGRAPFVRDEGGAVLILWAMFLAVAFGFLALAFDLGRISTTQTQLQSFADQVALAAAGELDGRSDAIDRARAAADGLIEGQQTFTTGSRRVLGGAGDYTLTFLTTLPADDGADDPGAVISDDSRGDLARYVRADVSERTVLTPFAHVNAVLTGGTQISSDIGASATAGFTSYACDITPLFFCVPDDSWRAKANVGQQIEAVSGSSGKSSTWTAGNFGFLDPSVLPTDPDGPCDGLSGAPLYRCLVGAERGITTCIRTNRLLLTRPGQAEGLTEAFNTRFDIFQKSMGKYSNDAAYRPAPNVLSDLWSDGTETTITPPNLPRDPCIAAGTCRFGEGGWDREGYLNDHHGGKWPIDGDPFSAFELPSRSDATRYDIYLAEIRSARARGDAGMLTETESGDENMGRPGNHVSARTASDRADLDPARRTVVAAAVNCNGRDMNGRSDVAPLEYVRLFMTEPVRGSGKESRIVVEVVGSAGGIGSGAEEAAFQDLVQLYR